MREEWKYEWRFVISIGIDIVFVQVSFCRSDIDIIIACTYVITYVHSAFIARATECWCRRVFEQVRPRSRRGTGPSVHPFQCCSASKSNLSTWVCGWMKQLPWLTHSLTHIVVRNIYRIATSSSFNKPTEEQRIKQRKKVVGCSILPSFFPSFVAPVESIGGAAGGSSSSSGGSSLSGARLTATDSPNKTSCQHSPTLSLTHSLTCSPPPPPPPPAPAPSPSPSPLDLCVSPQLSLLLPLLLLSERASERASCRRGKAGWGGLKPSCRHRRCRRRCQLPSSSSSSCSPPLFAFSALWVFLSLSLFVLHPSIYSTLRTLTAAIIGWVSEWVSERLFECASLPTPHHHHRLKQIKPLHCCLQPLHKCMHIFHFILKSKPQSHFHLVLSARRCSPLWARVHE